MTDTALKITGYSLASPLGLGIKDTLNALQSSQSGLRRFDYTDAKLDTWIGRVNNIEELCLSDDLKH